MRGRDGSSWGFDICKNAWFLLTVDITTIFDLANESEQFDTEKELVATVDYQTVSN